MTRAILLIMAVALLASGHPMGNSSVNHYARFEVTRRGVELRYVLDLAGLPTVDLLASWKLDRTSARNALEAKAREQSQGWLSWLQITVDGKPIHPKLGNVDLVIADRARISAQAHLDVAAGTLTYEDRNFAGHAGWKEIVILAGDGTTLHRASQTNKDLSKGLIEYPSDPAVVPPQDLHAELKWSVEQRGDFLSRLLREREITPWMILVGIAA